MLKSQKDALGLFVNAVRARNSHLVDTTNDRPLHTDESIIAKVEYSVLNVFDERCNKTNRRKATWTYNRITGKAGLNRLYTNEHVNDPFTRKTRKG